MNKIHDLILTKLKSEFEQNNLIPNKYESQDNIWVMATSVIPFHESLETSSFLPYNLKESQYYEGAIDEEKRKYYLEKEIPTHIVRIILRTSSSLGTSQYVDGTDVYLIVDRENQIADINIWAESWLEDAPKFHGGTIQDAMSWIRQMSEPFYLQYKDHFLTSEQRIALNGHDEDYLTEKPIQDLSCNNAPDDENWI